MLKAYAATVALGLLDLIMIGCILPTLFSANDYFSVGAGVLFVVVLIPVNVWGVTRISRYINLIKKY